MPNEPKIYEQIPTEAQLRALIENDCIDAAQSLIDKFKLPFKIVNGYLEKDKSIGEQWLDKFITIHSQTIEMKKDAIKCSKTEYEVLICGETGTGKELIAKSMIGERKGITCVANCAGLPTELIESELFGHLQGSFTGAFKTKEGLFSVAKDGVMFLDEMGELPMSVQGKLLRALQEKKIRKVGAKEEEDITCKFVCATNRDLKKMVSEGLFRQDLYARISTLELDILPLRDRTCDIIPILESMKASKEFINMINERIPPRKDPDLKLDLSLNVRSLQKYWIRYNVLGKI
jgi:transcriptional regulator with PAS, ATPase and Fis domain